MPDSANRSAILLIQTAFIGDVILATALLEYLHRTEPNTPVDFLVRKGNEGLLKGHPYVRHVLIWDKKKEKYRGLWHLLQQIRRTGYGRVVTLQRFASTGLLTAFSGAPERVGFDKNPFARGFTRTAPHVIGDGVHEVTRNLHLLNPAYDGPAIAPHLFPTAQDEAAAAPFAAVGQYLCIAPTSVWFTKQFPEEQWLKLLAALPSSYTVYLLGGPPDVEACESLLQASGRPNTVNLAGKLSLLASAALMRGATLNYVNDSAPMHLCSAVGAPVCAVYCSTVPAFGFGPLSPFSRIVMIPEELACQPCGLHGYRQCPLGHFRCAHGIHTQQLLAVLAEREAPTE
ncbi:glycosyltransferase family 9 protein [Hymenobacter taeanensis]|uniref:Glycosyltransferase family 9 protein n=1 Tax=Hymenobacter taeanensis TaxID=2735321 RepID=A0A6M6BCH8_9BACT|nr:MULTISPECIES: glycosyltransferase family 9 protein [Hymenobacter]QJX45907.1 glycosyltransferase family 9 protein [Hymenobacter taeanensis]UOQ79753.1 glycosyltransferase family 9 protein [Hymenobacter sp. 5414T-23]